MKKYIDLIKTSKLFEKISENDIYSMLSCLSTEEKNLSKGDYIYRAGERSSKTAMVLEGMIHIYKEDYWGNNSILAEVSQGELLGEVYAFLDDEPMAVNAVAVKDSTVMLMDMKKVFTVCDSICPYHTRLIQNLVHVISVKNRELTRKMEHLSQRMTRDKLLSYLSEQSIKHGSSNFEIPFNRQQLADYLAVDRSAMSKELGRLRKEGILEFSKSHFSLIGREMY